MSKTKLSAGYIGKLRGVPEANICIVCGKAYYNPESKCCSTACRKLFKQARNENSYTDPRGAQRPLSVETMYDVILWRIRRPELTLEQIAQSLTRDPEVFIAQILEAERDGSMERARRMLDANGRIRKVKWTG